MRDSRVNLIDRVRSDGRLKIQFHENPGQLADYCARAQNAFSDHPQCPKTKQRKASAPFLDETNIKVRPRLNIAIHIVGSRGDVQPFIPIAQMLMGKPYGHRVRICTHPIYKDFVESRGIEFFSIGGDPQALMAYMVKNPGLLPGRRSVKAGDIKMQRREMAEIINGCWRSCIEAGDGMGEKQCAASAPSGEKVFLADVIIANPPSMTHIHAAEKLGIPLHMVFTMPWSPTQTLHHPLASMSYGDTDTKVANYLSFMVMELLTWQGLGDIINKFRTRTLHLDPISPLWGCQLLPRLRVPYSYLWSQSLIPKPADWDDHITITGFSFLPMASKYTPPPELSAFLEHGPPPVYVGFGSIVVENPAALTELVFEALRLANVRGIVAKGWGDVGGSDLEVPDNVYLIDNCPHDWLFQHVSCVVHHGGAGTTAAGISAGKPTVVVPFFGDQPFWGSMIAKAGAGPTPIPFKKMTAQSLADSILFALEEPKVLQAVQDMANQIANEDGAHGAVEDIDKRLNVDDLRCDVAPERVAHWKHRKSGAHLSSFVYACLVDAGICQPADFKLIRHIDWYVQEGAESPIIGAIAAFSGFVGDMQIATGEYVERLKRKRPPSSGITIDSSNTSTGPRASEATTGSAAPLSQPVPQDSTDSHFARGRLRPPASGAPTPEQLRNVAIKLAKKTLRGDLDSDRFGYQPTFHERRVAEWKAREQHPTYGRGYYITRATARYVMDMTEAGLGVPTAFFYNVANGFHNYPSYVFKGDEARRRKAITGLGSGCRVAGEEFVMGIWEAFSGFATRPAKGFKKEGAKGIGKGMLKAVPGFFLGLGAATFGLPGYTLKGVEKELSKHRVTELKAELMLIRLRQGIWDFRVSTAAEREEAFRKWKVLMELVENKGPSS